MAEEDGSDRSKKWYWIAGGLFAAAFLGAFGTAAFGWISDSLKGEFDIPFNANLTEWKEGGCEGFVLDESLLRDLPVDQDGDIDADWVADHGGLQTGPRLLNLSIVGDDDTTVAITGIRLSDVTELPLPASPVIVFECPPMGGELSNLNVILDYETKTGEIINADEKPVSAISVGGGEPPVTLDFNAKGDDESADCYCTWRLAIEWTSATNDGTFEVDLDGEPLALVTKENSWPNYWTEDGAVWHYDENGEPAPIVQ